jgi:hypothetical protein
MLKFRSELLLIFVFLLLNFIAGFSQRPIVNLPLKNGVYEIGSVRFEWDFEFCSQFEVQISDDSLFQQNLWVLNLNSNSLNHSFLVPGIHFFRVKCSTGDFSTPVKFEIIDLASFGNVKLHFRADSGLVIQNNKISKWINLADTTLSLVQTSDNFRPSYSPFGLTGKSAVQFGGNNTATWLNFESVFTVDSFAFFQVFQQLSTASILQYFLAGTNRGFFWGGTAGSGYNLGIFDGAAVFSNNSPQSTLPRIGCQTKNAIYGASGQLSASFIVGNQLSSMALSTLGTRPDATNLFSNGLCSEIILFDNHLNSTAAKRVIDFLKSRFSTPVNLPFDTLACAPNVVFTLPNNGSLASILWSNGSTQLQSIYSTPGRHWVRVVNRFGVTLTDTFSVSGVFPAPIVSSSGIQPLCLGDTLNQVYVNPDPVQPWQWNTGTSSDTLRITQPGQFWLLQTDSSGCVLSSDTLEVINRVDGEIALSVLGCTGDTTIFQAQVGDLLGSPIVYYDWDFGPFGSPDTLHQASASTVFSQPGPQTARLIAYNSLGCPDTVALTIQVPGSPVAQFSAPHACAATPLPLNNQCYIPPGTPVSSYRWDFWNGQSSNLVGPSLMFPDTGLYSISLKVSLANGCSDSIALVVHAFRRASAAFSLPFDSLCQFSPLPLSDASNYLNSNPGEVVWKLSGSAPDTAGSTQLSPNLPGLLPLWMYIKSAEGCIDSVRREVWVNATPQAEVGLSQQLGFPPLSVAVWDASDKSYPDRWFGLNAAEFWTDSLRSFSLSDTGLYRFKLRVSDNLGCLDSAEKTLRLIRPELSTRILNLSCEKQGSVFRPSFSLENSSVLLPIQGESFDFWLENSGVLHWDETKVVAPGNSVLFNPELGLQAPASPRFCCVRPVELISEYAPGLFLKVSGEPSCAPIGQQFFLANVVPNPSQGDVQVRFHLNSPGQVRWNVVGAEGKTVHSGEGSYSEGMQSLTIPSKTLAAGLYTLILIQGDQVGIGRFIVLE